MEEAENLCVSFSEWLALTQKSFGTLTDRSEPLDRQAMEKKMKKLEVLICWSQFGLDLYICSQMPRHVAVSYYTGRENGKMVI